MLEDGDQEQPLGIPFRLDEGDRGIGLPEAEIRMEGAGREIRPVRRRAVADHRGHPVEVAPGIVVQPGGIEPHRRRRGIARPDLLRIGRVGRGEEGAEFRLLALQDADQADEVGGVERRIGDRVPAGRGRIGLRELGRRGEPHIPVVLGLLEPEARRAGRRAALRIERQADILVEPGQAVGDRGVVVQLDRAGRVQVDRVVGQRQDHALAVGRGMVGQRALRGELADRALRIGRFPHRVQAGPGAQIPGLVERHRIMPFQLLVGAEGHPDRPVAVALVDLDDIGLPAGIPHRVVGELGIERQHVHRIPLDQRIADRGLVGQRPAFHHQRLVRHHGDVAADRNRQRLAGRQVVAVLDVQDAVLVEGLLAVEMRRVGAAGRAAAGVLEPHGAEIDLVDAPVAAGMQAGQGRAEGLDVLLVQQRRVEAADQAGLGIAGAVVEGQRPCAGLVGRAGPGDHGEAVQQQRRGLKAEADLLQPQIRRQGDAVGTGRQRHAVIGRRPVGCGELVGELHRAGNIQAVQDQVAVAIRQAAIGEAEIQRVPAGLRRGDGEGDGRGGTARQARPGEHRIAAAAEAGDVAAAAGATRKPGILGLVEHAGGEGDRARTGPAAARRGRARTARLRQST